MAASGGVGAIGKGRGGCFKGRVCSRWRRGGDSGKRRVGGGRGAWKQLQEAWWRHRQGAWWRRQGGVVAASSHSCPSPVTHSPILTQSPPRPPTSRTNSRCRSVSRCCRRHCRRRHLHYYCSPSCHPTRHPHRLYTIPLRTSAATHTHRRSIPGHVAQHPVPRSVNVSGVSVK